MTCRACGYSEEKDPFSHSLTSWGDFIPVGQLSGEADFNVDGKPFWETRGLYACPKCGTVRIKLPGDE